MTKIFDFNEFKKIKDWDDEYPQFLGKVESFFGTKIEPEDLLKRLYFTIRFLEGTSKAFFIFSRLGIDLKGAEDGKKYIINWLEDIIDNLKNY